jgi:hypothetical protein
MYPTRRETKERMCTIHTEGVLVPKGEEKIINNPSWTEYKTLEGELYLRPEDDVPTDIWPMIVGIKVEQGSRETRDTSRFRNQNSRAASNYAPKVTKVHFRSLQLDDTEFRRHYNFRTIVEKIDGWYTDKPRASEFKKCYWKIGQSLLQKTVDNDYQKLQRLLISHNVAHLVEREMFHLMDRRDRLDEFELNEEWEEREGILTMRESITVPYLQVDVKAEIQRRERKFGKR